MAVRLVDGEGASSPELRAWCGERIRRECVPERWFFVAEVPKTGRGKVDRRALVAACLEGERR